MNAHALAATTTFQSEIYPSTEEWIAHTAAVTLAWSALDPGRSRGDRTMTEPDLWTVLELEADGAERSNLMSTCAAGYRIP